MCIRDRPRIVLDRCKFVPGRSRIVPDMLRIVPDRSKIVPDTLRIVPDRPSIDPRRLGIGSERLSLVRAGSRAVPISLGAQKYWNFLGKGVPNQRASVARDAGSAKARL